MAALFHEGRISTRYYPHRPSPPPTLHPTPAQVEATKLTSVKMKHPALEPKTPPPRSKIALDETDPPPDTDETGPRTPPRLATCKARPHSNLRRFEIGGAKQRRYVAGQVRSFGIRVLSPPPGVSPARVHSVQSGWSAHRPRNTCAKCRHTTSSHQPSTPPYARARNATVPIACCTPAHPPQRDAQAGRSP